MTATAQCWTIPAVGAAARGRPAQAEHDVLDGDVWADCRSRGGVGVQHPVPVEHRCPVPGGLPTWKLSDMWAARTPDINTSRIPPTTHPTPGGRPNSRAPM